MLNCQILNKNFLSKDLHTLEHLFKSEPEGMEYINKLLNFVVDDNLRLWSIETIKLTLTGISYPDQDEEKQALLVHFYEITEYLISIDLKNETNRKTISAYLDISYYTLLLILRKIRSGEIRIDKDSSKKGVLKTISYHLDLSVGLLGLHIQDLFKRIKNKDFSQEYAKISEESFLSYVGKKMVICDFENMFELIFRLAKLTLNPDGYENCSELNIDYGKLGLGLKNLFSIMFEYLLINLKGYESTILAKIHSGFNFQRYLTFSYLLLDYVSQKKFTEEGDGYDFNSIFPSFLEFFYQFYNNFRFLVLDRLTDYFFIIDNIDNYTLSKFENYLIPPYLLNLNNGKLRNFIFHHLVFMESNDNAIECTGRNLWVTSAFDFYGFSEFLEKILKILINYLRSQVTTSSALNTCSKISQTNLNESKSKIIVTTVNFSTNRIVENILEIFSDFFGKKTKIMLPKKFVMFKETYIAVYLNLLNYYISTKKFKHYSGYLNYNYKVNVIANSLEELSLGINKNYFLLCNNILTALKGDGLRKKLRIYPNSPHLMWYFEFPDLNILDFDIQLNNKENNDNNINQENVPMFLGSKRKAKTQLKFDITPIKDLILPMKLSEKGIAVITCKKSNKTTLKLRDVNSCVVIYQTSDSQVIVEEPRMRSLKELTYSETICRELYEALLVYTGDIETDEAIKSNFLTTMKYYELDSMSYDTMVDGLVLILEIE